MFDGSCKIDIHTRRFCQFCRLEKCFAVGMKKQFILSEDAKRKRAHKKDVRPGHFIPISDDVTILTSQPSTPVAAVPIVSEAALLTPSLAIAQGAGE